MSKLLCCDFNNYCFRMLFIKDVEVKTQSPNFALWRYKVYENIFKLIERFRSVDEVVIAIDDKVSWRKSYFNRYKESRKTKREKQEEINWEQVFKQFEDLRKDLIHHMPFKVLKVRSAEADDIIAIIAGYVNKEVIISSNDEDYLQVSSDRVKIWNHFKERFVKQPANIENWLIGKILTGQSKDDIFNVMTPNNWGLTEGTQGKRKPGLGPKTAEKIINSGLEKWLDENTKVKKHDITISYKENFKRNNVLINFDMIPKTICNRVLDAYENCRFPPPSNIYQFFQKHNMRGFLDDFQKTENVLMRLY